MGHIKSKNSNHYVRAALYARVSSEQQAQAQTIASQREALEERITKDGFKLDRELSFIDDGYSGASLVRPALERLRDMASLGAIDKLYVLCPDRFARNYAYQVLVIDELQCCGVDIVFLNHEIGDSPEEHLLLQVQGIIAEYERGKIMERCRRGKLHSARQGTVNVLGGAPYGYRYVTSQEAGGQARYEIKPEEAQIVQQIFAWVAQERCSIREVCRRLKQDERTRDVPVIFVRSNLEKYRFVPKNVISIWLLRMLSFGVWKFTFFVSVSYWALSAAKTPKSLVTAAAIIHIASPPPIQFPNHP